MHYSSWCVQLTWSMHRGSQCVRLERLPTDDLDFQETSPHLYLLYSEVSPVSSWEFWWKIPLLKALLNFVSSSWWLLSFPHYRSYIKLEGFWFDLIFLVCVSERDHVGLCVGTWNCVGECAGNGEADQAVWLVQWVTKCWISTQTHTNLLAILA